MNPIFPIFKPFTESDFLHYQKFIYRFPQHCDFTVNNMMIWLASDSEIDFSWLNDNIVLRINGSVLRPSLKPWYTVLGDIKADESLHTLHNKASIKELFMVPDYFVESIKNKNDFVISEDANNRDYIVNIDDLLAYSGNEYENFRYQVKYFLKNYSEEALLKELDLSKPEDIKEVINALHTWPKVRSFEDNGNDPQKSDAKAINRLITLQPVLPVKHQCIGLYVRGELQGFSIFHVPNSKDHIAMGNHIKTNSEFNRLFDFLVYATASKLKQLGIEYINAEQDLGIEGLRHHKLQFNPFTFYKKYTIAMS